MAPCPPVGKERVKEIEQNVTRWLLTSSTPMSDELADAVQAIRNRVQEAAQSVRVFGLKEATISLNFLALGRPQKIKYP
jgi:hypothetical protein